MMSQLISHRASFISDCNAPEIKEIAQCSSKLQDDLLRQLLKFVMDSLVREVDYHDFCTVHGVDDQASEDNLLAVYAGLYSLMKCALRHSSLSIKQNLKDDLTNLGVPLLLHDDIVNYVFGQQRLMLHDKLKSDHPCLLQLQELKWRVDVTISTSALNRVLEPSIIMQMRFSDGSERQFEVTIPRFHQLRHSVACLLKQMMDLEKHSILKIQD